MNVADRGFQYGDGVFTTLPVREGVAVFLSRHFGRLERDCQRLAIPFVGRDMLLGDMNLLLDQPPLDGVLKIQITRGSGGRGYRPPERVLPTRVTALHPPPVYPAEFSTRGVNVRYCRTRLGINPVLAGIKHMNRLEQVLARAEWPHDDIAEGLMLDPEGRVVEGTMSNLFVVMEGRVFTPRLDQCGVSGVMRRMVLEGVADLGRRIEEKRVYPADLEAADELILTNSLIGIWPIRRLEERLYPVGPVTQELAEWLNTKIRAEKASASVS